MSFTKVDSYLSYELGKNQLKIRITDKYFSPYSLIKDTIEILDLNKLGDKKALAKLKEDMYKTATEVKSSSIDFPLQLTLTLKEEEFIIF